MRVSQIFSVPHPREDVWNVFQDIEALANCFPGAKITKLESKESFTGEVTARLGPMRLHFVGDGQADWDHGSWSGRLHGKGRDKGSNSGTKATVTYQLVDIAHGSETQIEVGAEYVLSGSIAQIGRGPIVEEFVRQITAQFSANLNEMLKRSSDIDDSIQMSDEDVGELKVGRFLIKALYLNVRRVFARIFGK